MKAEQLALGIEEISRSTDSIFINARCMLKQDGDERVLIIAGVPAHRYHRDDTLAEDYATAFLGSSGLAGQREIGRAFGRSERTVRRNQERYALGGMEALYKKKGWRRGRRRISGRRLRQIARLREQGLSNREIARRLGVTEGAIRKLVGPSLPSVTSGLIQGELFPETASVPSVVVVGAEVGSSEPGEHATNVQAEQRKESVETQEESEEETEERETAGLRLDSDPEDRTLDRLAAVFGLLDDARPLFGTSEGVKGAGVLLAIPALVTSGIFGIARNLYGEIGPAFYGLRTTLLTFLLMALLRIQRPEAMKERDPAVLGKVLGLDRAPEVKTLRRKLTRLASFAQATRLGEELARRRVQDRGRMIGFLYVDGHVRAYHGKQRISKAHVATRRLAMPATTDYWINDRAGDPLFLLTAAASASLAKELPGLLDEIRKFVGQRRVTIVFDRGGWSPELFQLMLSKGFDLLTYRKGKKHGISPSRFVPRRAKIDGQEVEYRLHDQPARFLRGKLRLRQVTRLTDDDHQTQIITSRWDLPDVEVAYRMFNRWRQENFFKYMREEFLLDALADYDVEPEDPTRTVPNPERRALDKKIREARETVERLEREYGAAAMDSTESKRPTMRGFKIAHGKTGKQLRAARERLAELRTRKRSLPARVGINDRSDVARVRLATERKHLTDLLKMVAYQAESDLFALLHPVYPRAEQEGRTLLHSVFSGTADLEVKDDGLHVRLAPLSAPHRTQAMRALCSKLSETDTLFPGTNLPMRFSIQDRPQEGGLAFPAPRARKTADFSQPDSTPKPDSS